MEKLYICHTLYHIYMTLVKQIEKNEQIDLIISSTVPNYTEIGEKIKKINIIRDVIYIKEEEINDKLLVTGLKRFSYATQLINHFESCFIFDFLKYNEVFIYHDGTKIGKYLIAKKIKYNLIEDALNSFVIIDQYIDIKFTILQRILSLFNLTILSFGQSYIAKSIEVNDIKDIKIPHKKVIEVNRETLLNSLTNMSKQMIYDVFLGEAIDITGNNTALILTQPLYNDAQVKLEREQMDIYYKIIKQYELLGYKVYLKPHPRDNMDYSHILADITIIDKNIPIEVFNFNPNIVFDIAITISSTSIEGIKFAKNKVYLGFNYITGINL